MTNHPKTDITVLVDRSGSMASLLDDTISGINSFQNQQKEDPINTRYTYIQFDTEYEVVHNDIPVVEVPELTRKTFVPRGGTALLDAIAKTINGINSRIALMTEKPEKIIVVIVTDGEENSSRETTRDKVFEMIIGCRAQDWEFIFLGANQDAIKEASNLGIRASHTHNYSSGAVGTAAVYASSGAAVRNMKRGSFRGFTLSERGLSQADNLDLTSSAILSQHAAAASADAANDALVAAAKQKLTQTVGVVPLTQTVDTPTDTVVTSSTVEDDESSTV